MNLSGTIETALAGILSETVESAARIWYRTSRNQRKPFEANGRFSGEAFPQICIAASGKYWNDVLATYAMDISIDIATETAIDETAETRAAIEEALESYFDKLQEDSETQAAFESRIKENFARFNFGGFICDSPSSNSTEEELFTLSQTYRLYFSLN